MMNNLPAKKNIKKNLTLDWNRTELEFLPAALEIVETPPSPIGRALLWIIVLFFITALTWSVIGRVDEVAVAPGKVIPSGYTKTVQAEDKGIVRRINVANGTRVSEGDVLIELDTVTTEADVSRLRKERDFYTLDLARLYAERNGKDFIPPDGIGGPEEILQQSELSRARRLEFNSRMDTLRQQVLMAQSTLDNAVKQRQKYEKLLPIAAEQRKRTEELAEDGTVSLFEHQNYLQKEIELRQDLLSQGDEVERCQ